MMTLMGWMIEFEFLFHSRPVHLTRFDQEMGKRKVESDDEEEFDGSDVSREPTPPPKKKSVKKPKVRCTRGHRVETLCSDIPTHHLQPTKAEEISEDEKPASKSKSLKPTSSKGKVPQVCHHRVSDTSILICGFIEGSTNIRCRGNSSTYDV